MSDWSLEVESGPNGIVGTGRNEKGDSFRVHLIPVFPGVTVAVNEIHCEMLPPSAGTESTFREPPVSINYALAGNCEVERLDGSITAVRGGELSVSQIRARRQQRFPGSLYEGIEIYLDPPVMEEQSGWLRDQFGIDTEWLLQQYYGRDGVRICQTPRAIGQIVEQVRKILQAEEPDRILLRLLVLQLLHDLQTSLYPESSHMYLTESQVALAHEAERRMMEDLRVTVTARNLAREFQISDTSLKNYFHIVYGISMAAYLRRKRMARAARLLVETDLPVGRVAEEVGYGNQSKFAAVFREEYGRNPLEYRRSGRTQENRTGRHRTEKKRR